MNQFFDFAHGPSDHRQIHALTAAQYMHCAAIAGLGAAHMALQIAAAFYARAIEFKNDVAGFQTRLVGWRLRHDFGDGCALVFLQFLCLRIHLIHITNTHAQIAALHRAGGAQLIGDFHGLINGYGQRNAHIAARATQDLAVDAYHFAAHIDQRTTRVARVNRHIGLNKAQVLPRIALLGADYASSHRVLKTERRTNGNDPLADAQLADIAHAHKG